MPVESPQQRYFEDVKVGDQLEPVEFPLSVYRLVMEAGACRDFNSIHHNSEYAKATGAPEMYAATSFLLGTWERTVRDHIGLDGTIRSIRGFRMKKFNPVGTTTIVRGEVTRAVEEDGVGVLEMSIWCQRRRGDRRPRGGHRHGPAHPLRVRDETSRTRRRWRFRRRLLFPPDYVVAGARPGGFPIFSLAETVVSR